MIETHSYDPNNPPPKLVTISLEEYDKIKKNVGELLTLHTMLRSVRPIVMGEEIPKEELDDIRMSYTHFLRDHKIQ